MARRLLFAASDVLAGGVGIAALHGSSGWQTTRAIVLQPFFKSLDSGIGGMRDWNWLPGLPARLGVGDVLGQGFGVYTVPLSGGPARLLKHPPGSREWTSVCVGILHDALRRL